MEEKKYLKLGFCKGKQRILGSKRGTLSIAGGHDVRAKDSFSNWGHMRESDTHSQNYGQSTAAHSKIILIRLDHDFLSILL
jgi:hypothetical protein